MFRPTLCSARFATRPLLGLLSHGNDLISYLLTGRGNLSFGGCFVWLMLLSLFFSDARVLEAFFSERAVRSLDFAASRVLVFAVTVKVELAAVRRSRNGQDIVLRL